MHEVHSKWREPTGRQSEKRQAVSDANADRAKRRWAAVAAKTASVPTQTAPKPNQDDTCTSKPSTSAKKMAHFSRAEDLNESFASSESDIGADAGEFVLVHRSVWSKLISPMLCSQCKGKELKVFMTETHGFVKKVIVKCLMCEEVLSQVYSSPRLPQGKAEISTRPPFMCNRRAVDSFLDIGTGYCGLERFCAAMGTDKIALNAYMDHLHKIMLDNENTREEILHLARDAVKKAYVGLDPTLADEDVIDIEVTYDGSWPKRGFTSLIGFASVIYILTGLVVDFVVLSKHCHVCAVRAIECEGAEFEKWQKEHKESGECDVNFSGSSGMMETFGAEVLWKRSIAKNKFRYTSVLSDGDAKVITHLNDNVKPYGDKKIEKEECLNHVDKRLGTSLRNLVKDEKARGITLGGNKAGSLKDSTIVKMQSYYRKAIKTYIPDIPKTKKAIMATLDHMNSTDTKPKHKNCPTGKESWCFFNKAKANCVKPKSHKDMSVSLNDLVYQKVKPVYERLSDKKLLSRCTRLATQNSNECLHSVIWNKCPKELFMSKRRYEIGITRGIGEFNMGLEAMVAMKNPTPKKQTAALKIAKAVDKRRMRQSERQKERVQTRAKKKADKKKKDTAAKKKDGVFYASGAF